MNFVFESIKELIFYLSACTGGNKGDEMRDERKKEASTHESYKKTLMLHKKFRILPQTQILKWHSCFAELVPLISASLCSSRPQLHPSSKHYLNYEFQFDLLQKHDIQASTKVV